MSRRALISYMVRRTLKLLHEVGAVGVMGSIAASIVLLLTAPKESLVGYAAVQQGIAAIAKWLLVPSLAIVLVSGMLAIAATEAYKNAAWAWVKALLGISVFEGTLLTVSANARQAAELSAQAAVGQGDAAQLAQALHTEWGGLWILMAVSFVNILLAVWRPRLVRPAR